MEVDKGDRREAGGGRLAHDWNDKRRKRRRARFLEVKVTCGVQWGSSFSRLMG